jgi:hypothetical protein
MPAATDSTTRWENRFRKGHWIKRGFWHAIYYLGRGLSFMRWRPYTQYTFSEGSEGNLSIKPITLHNTQSTQMKRMFAQHSGAVTSPDPNKTYSLLAGLPRKILGFFESSRDPDPNSDFAKALPVSGSVR